MTAPQTPYRFTPEEMRVLQECNRESFYQRCVPLSGILGAATYMAVKSGMLQANAKFGSAPKVLGAVIVGYFLGKLSYQPKCAEKMMSIPDSKIGTILRNRKYGIQQDVLTMEDRDLEKAVSSIPESEKFSDISHNQLDMDLDRPLISSLEDYRPSSLDDIRTEGDTFLPTSPTRTTTYEELRRQNREEYEQKRTKAYRGVVVPEEVPSSLKVDDHSPLEKKPTQPTNIYGDLWER